MPSKTSSRFPEKAFANSIANALDAHMRNLNGNSCGNLQRMVVSAVEEQLASFAIRECEGNRTEAARMLGISRTTLARKANSNSKSNSKRR